MLKNEKIKNKVQLIYIDPPYSTNTVYRIGDKRTSTISSSNSDVAAYHDTMSGEKYFEFLRKRLILLREILSDTGSIYVHVDLKIGHYVKVLMDEVFGRENFLNDITRIKCNPKNFNRKAYGNVKDMILFYSKTGDHVWNDPREEYGEEDIKRLFPKKDENGRRYTTVPLHAPGETKNGPTSMPWRGLFPPKGRHWRYPPNVLERLDQEGKIEWSKNGVPRLIIYADEKVKVGKKVQDVWEFKDPQYPVYPTQKNLKLLERIIEASSNPGDIVLDAFSGSGTTLIAAELKGRNWIGIDNSIHAIKSTIKRLQKINDHKTFEVLVPTSVLNRENIKKLLLE